MGGEIFATPCGGRLEVFHTTCGWFADKCVDNRRDALRDGLVKMGGEKFTRPSRRSRQSADVPRGGRRSRDSRHGSIVAWRDRKSTRLNSSHVKISYAVFCLK